MSELIDEAVREALAEDVEDLAAFDKRADEPLISYDAMIKRLKKDIQWSNGSTESYTQFKIMN